MLTWDGAGESLTPRNELQDMGVWELKGSIFGLTIGQISPRCSTVHVNVLLVIDFRLELGIVISYRISMTVF